MISPMCPTHLRHLLLVIVLLLQGCGVTYRLVDKGAAAPERGQHEIMPGRQLQYLSCDYRSWYSKSKTHAGLPPVGWHPKASSLLVQSPENIDAAKEAFEYALMASNVYRDEPVFALPGWTFDSRLDSRSGLSVDVWRKGSKDKPSHVVVVYRGTDGLNWQDWKANLSFWFEPAQYHEAQAHFLDILNEPRFASASLTVTGHSLGGGIALNVSLRHSTPKRPIAAYAFNSSPRGFFGVSKSPAPARRVVLSENAEFLAALRQLWAPKLEGIDERVYNFLKFTNPLTRPVSEHSMYKLARGLLLLSIGYGHPDARKTFAANFDGQTVALELERRGSDPTDIEYDKRLCRSLLK